METAEMWMAISVITFGSFVWSAGIVVFVKLMIEIRWWEKLLTGLLAVEFPDIGPSGISGLVPMFQQMLQLVLKRVVWDARQATVVISVGLFLIGVAITMVGVYMLYW